MDPKSATLSVFRRTHNEIAKSFDASLQRCQKQEILFDLRNAAKRAGDSGAVLEDQLDDGLIAVIIADLVDSTVDLAEVPALMDQQISDVEDQTAQLEQKLEDLSLRNTKLLNRVDRYKDENIQLEQRLLDLERTRPLDYDLHKTTESYKQTYEEYFQLVKTHTELVLELDHVEKKVECQKRKQPLTGLDIIRSLRKRGVDEAGEETFVECLSNGESSLLRSPSKPYSAAPSVRASKTYTVEKVPPLDLDGARVSTRDIRSQSPEHHPFDNQSSPSNKCNSTRIGTNKKHSEPELLRPVTLHVTRPIPSRRSGSGKLEATKFSRNNSNDDF